jgi:hypothetical protein
MISLNRVQKLVKSMIGEIISQTSFLKFILRLHEVLAVWEAQAIEQLLKSPAMNKEHESAVLLFARKSEVSFTNNRAECDLRMSKVKQKVSGCFRTEIYAKAYCRISSYLQTMSAKGYNPLIAIQMAFAGEFV